MNPAIWGGLCALALGSADFIGRFTSRGLGASVALFGMLTVGSVILSAWVWLAGPALVWDAGGAWLLALNGLATMVMTLLLYAGLARGPVSVVAPIVASHPVLVLIFWVTLGARPAAIEWLAMAVTIAGVIVVARAAEPSDGGRAIERREFHVTLVIAGASSLAYAVLIVAGQGAVPIYGELQTLWLGRLIGLAALGLVFALRARAPRVPIRWWPLIGLQGCLDAGGYLFLFAGSHGEGREIAAVTASAFGAVTTLLARFVLRESMSAVQWGGIALVFSGIAVLSWPR